MHVFILFMQGDGTHIYGALQYTSVVKMLTKNFIIIALH